MGNELYGHNVDTNPTDMTVTATKLITSLFPIPGAATLGELISTIVPHQRLDRVVAVLQILHDKVESILIDVELLRSRLEKEDFQELLMSCLEQASKALTVERRNYIASFLYKTLTEDDISSINQQKLLSIFGQLDDIDILLLKFFDISQKHEIAIEHPFYLKHKLILEPPMVEENMTPEEYEKRMDEGTIYNEHLSYMQRLGVITTNSNVGLSEDQNRNFHTTPLGKRLLKYIDL